VCFLVATKKREGYWGTAGEGKTGYLPQYDSFMEMRGGIRGLLEMLLGPPQTIAATRLSTTAARSRYVGHIHGVGWRRGGIYRAPLWEWLLGALE